MYYKAFHVTGVINVTTYDAGLQSPDETPRHLNAVILNTDTTEGNLIEGWIGNKKVLEIYDYNCDTQEEAAAFTGLSIVKIGRLPIDLDIPEGHSFRIAINCGAVANDLYGTYEYEEPT